MCKSVTVGLRQFDVVGDGKGRDSFPEPNHAGFRHQPVRSLVAVHLRHQLAFTGVRNVGHNAQRLLAIARFDRERSVELAAVVPMLPARNGIEDGVAVAQAHGFDCHGIPGDIAQSPHGGEGIADFVPIVARSHVGGSAHAR